MKSFDDWFFNAPACVQEEVSGILLANFGDDYDAHSEAVTDWWDALDDEEKEEIYRENL